MPGALHGVKVLEIAQVMAIPVCGLLLSDLGADVVKLEPPWGDASRYTMQPVFSGESKSFAVLNRGKRSVCLNIADERARPALEALVRWADVVLVSVKDADLDAYHIGYRHLRHLNPQMVYLEHTGLGHKGPMGGLGSYDVIASGVSGLTALVGKERDGQPVYTQPAMTDMGTGYLSAMAVCAALYARQTTGQGQRIETSLLATGVATAGNVAHDFRAVDPALREEFVSGLAELRARGAPYVELQAHRNRTVNRGRHGNVYYRYYKTRDSFISVGCLSPALQAKFREVTGIQDPREDPQFDARGPDGWERLARFVGETELVLASRTTDEWLSLFRKHKIPCGPVIFPEEAIYHPQVTENEFVIDLEHELLGPYRTFAPPVRMDATPTRAQGPAPPLGKHTEAVLREAGLDEATIASLIEAGVAGGRALKG